MSVRMLVIVVQVMAMSHGHGGDGRNEARFPHPSSSVTHGPQHTKLQEPLASSQAVPKISHWLTFLALKTAASVARYSCPTEEEVGRCLTLYS
eukprot:s935_g8.t1